MTARHIAITGPPGIGKTTLVKKILTQLEEKNISVRGFYTEEQRSENGQQRIGFKIITTDGQNAPLASIKSTSRYRVGQYGVEVEQFEKLALTQLQQIFQDIKKGVVVIDEIGKMELFSDAFKRCVLCAFKKPDIVILTTIPVSKGRPIEFVENVRSNTDVKLFTVDRSNRNSLADEIFSHIVTNLTSLK